MTPALEPHQRRVIDELRRLKEKRERLRVFIEGGSAVNIFSGLPDDEKERLQRQYAIMGQYADILKERIDHFPKPEAKKIKIVTGLRGDL